MSATTDRVPSVGRGLSLDRAGRRAACLGTLQQGGAAAPQAAGAAHRKTSRRPTLDELLVSAWEDLRAAQATDCPVCGGTMRSRRGAGPAGGTTGACGDCGSVLS